MAAAKKTRTDIFNLSMIAEKLPKSFTAKKLKLDTLFNGSNYYVDNKEIDKIKAVIEKEAAKKIVELDKLKHNHPNQ